MNSEQPSPKKAVSPDAVSPPSSIAKAASFASSMTRWAADGFSTVEPERHAARTAVCATCKYHDATVCTVCGCYTDKKAWLPHEDCPLGKWPG